MTKLYYSLLRRDGHDAPWGIEFGDYERKTVSDEMDEYRENGETLANLRIIKTADDQASINAKVAELNGPPAPLREPRADEMKELRPAAPLPAL